MGAKMKSQLINKLKQEIKFIESKSEKELNSTRLLAGVNCLNLS